jgi:Holliday junction resolvase RusA-like endonuclease
MSNVLLCEYVVHGAPVPWTVYARGRGAPSPTFHKMQAWQDQIRATTRTEWGDVPCTGPIRLDMEFYRPRSKDCPRIRPASAKRWMAKHILMRPDRSNYAKACEDALNGLVYLDDSQVVDGSISKRYAPTYSEGFTVIRVYEVDLLEET